MTFATKLSVLVCLIIPAFACSTPKVSVSTTILASADQIMEQSILLRQREAPMYARVMAEGVVLVADSTPIYVEEDEAMHDDQSLTKLRAIAQYMIDNSEIQLTIAGHGESTDEYALSIGDKRAQSAKAYLTFMGVEEPRINIVAFGNDTEKQEDEYYFYTERAEAAQLMIR